MTLLTLAGCESTPSKRVGDADSKRHHITAGENPDCGKLLHYVRQIYPKEAEQKRIQGIVRLRVVVTKIGELRDIEVLQGDPLLSPAAVDAVKQWRYAPCVLNSTPVDFITTIDVDFTLNQ